METERKEGVFITKEALEKFRKDPAMLLRLADIVALSDDKGIAKVSVSALAKEWGVQWIQAKRILRSLFGDENKPGPCGKIGSVPEMYLDCTQNVSGLYLVTLSDCGVYKDVVLRLYLDCTQNVPEMYLDGAKTAQNAVFGGDSARHARIISHVNTNKIYNLSDEHNNSFVSVIDNTQNPILSEESTTNNISKKELTKRKTEIEDFRPKKKADKNVSGTDFTESPDAESKPRKPRFDFHKALVAAGVSETTARDWMMVRKAKDAVNSETAFAQLKEQFSEAAGAGVTAEECILMAVENSWRGFKYKWYAEEKTKLAKTTAWGGRKLESAARGQADTHGAPPPKYVTRL